MLNQVMNRISNIFQTLKNFSYGEPIGESGNAASERLKSVLVQDRSSLNTETLNALKIDLVNVISKYLMIDKKSIEIQLKRNASSMTLISNIPIASVRTHRQRNIIGNKHPKRQPRKSSSQVQT